MAFFRENKDNRYKTLLSKKRLLINEKIRIEKEYNKLSEKQKLFANEKALDEFNSSEKTILKASLILEFIESKKVIQMLIDEIQTLKKENKMLKKLITLIVLLLTLSCSNDKREVYQLEVATPEATDTFNIEVAYNKDLRNLEHSVINSTYFTKEGIEIAFNLANQHPLGIFYADTLAQTKSSLIQYIETPKNPQNPLGFRLNNKTLFFNRDLVVPVHVGKISAFKILSITNLDSGEVAEQLDSYDKKLLEFINDPNVTAEQLDAIPYVSTTASANIVNARPINSEKELNDVPYVSDEAVKRIRDYAESLP